MGLDPLNRKVVSAWLHAFAQNAQMVGYGFSSAGCRVEADANGQPRYRPADPGRGLTCASYIVFVLDQLGFELLRTVEWPSRPEDTDWQNEILSVLTASGCMTPDELNTIASDIGSVRFRPIEVAAAATRTQIPVSFAEAQAIAAQIMATCSALS
jgi:hypothetical protein